MITIQCFCKEMKGKIHQLLYRNEQNDEFSKLGLYLHIYFLHRKQTQRFSDIWIKLGLGIIIFIFLFAGSTI